MSSKPGSKQRREDDELSLSPSDADITELLVKLNTKEVEVTAEITVEPAGDEAELLKSLEADFIDDELVGGKINQCLANIASKRWGITLPSHKLKLLAKQTIGRHPCHH